MRFFTIVMLLLEAYFLHAQINQISLYPSTKFEKNLVSSSQLSDFKIPISNESKIGVHLPLTEPRITSPFGWRRHPVTHKADFHQGVDLVAKDKIVRNIMEGKVIEARYHKNLGNYVCIDHGNIQSVYGHLSVITVELDQIIPGGYPIGITGSTGRVTGEHLHFGIMNKGTYINSWKFLQTLINQE